MSRWRNDKKSGGLVLLTSKYDMLKRWSTDPRVAPAFSFSFLEVQSTFLQRCKQLGIVMLQWLAPLLRWLAKLDERIRSLDLILLSKVNFSHPIMRQTLRFAASATTAELAIAAYPRDFDDDLRPWMVLRIYYTRCRLRKLQE